MTQALIADGLVAFVKRACPTCSMIEPQLQEASRARRDFQVVTQDDPAFPAAVANLVDDRELDYSYLNHIEATLPPDVMLVAVRPSVQDQRTHVSITVLARRTEDIEEFQEKAIFVRMTGAGLKESGPHDVEVLG